MERRNRIETNPDILTGKPVVKGTRIAVELVVDLLANGWSMDQLQEQYSALSRADILACLQYAGKVLKSERVYPFSSPVES